MVLVVSIFPLSLVSRFRFLAVEKSFSEPMVLGFTSENYGVADVFDVWSVGDVLSMLLSEVYAGSFVVLK